MNEKVCANCKYYDSGVGHGICRKNPPIPVIKKKIFKKKNQSGFEEVEVTTSKFPSVTHPDKDWCGEFEEEVF